MPFTPDQPLPEIQQAISDLELEIERCVRLIEEARATRAQLVRLSEALHDRAVYVADVPPPAALVTIAH